MKCECAVAGKDNKGTGPNKHTHKAHRCSATYLNSYHW